MRSTSLLAAALVLCADLTAQSVTNLIRQIKTPEYTLSVVSAKDNQKYFIFNDKTSVSFTANKTNGFSKGDYLKIRHTFQGGENLFIDYNNQGPYSFSIQGFIMRGTNKLTSADFDTKRLHWYEKIATTAAMIPIRELGNKFYENISQAVTSNCPPKIPTSESNNLLWKMGEEVRIIQPGTTNEHFKQFGTDCIKLSKDVLRNPKYK